MPRMSSLGHAAAVWGCASPDVDDGAAPTGGFVRGERRDAAAKQAPGKRNAGRDAPPERTLGRLDFFQRLGMTRMSKARVSKARVSKARVSKTPVSKTLVSNTRKAADALPAAADALPAAADALPAAADALPAAADALPALPQDDTNNKGPAVPTCKSDSAPAAGESAAGTANSDEPDAPSAPKWCGQIFVRRIVRSEDDPLTVIVEGVKYRIGDTKAHDTSSDDTVQSVIETVPGAEYLLYAGKALNRGEATLSECGVGKNSTVDAVGRLGGGGVCMGKPTVAQAAARPIDAPTPASVLSAPSVLRPVPMLLAPQEDHRSGTDSADVSTAAGHVAATASYSTDTAADGTQEEASSAQAARLAEAVRVAKQDFEARLQRLEEGEGAVHVTAGNQMPMYEQIGHTQPRSERGEWRDKLTAPVELKPLQRDPELDGKILRGELGETVRNCVLHEDKRIVSFLLSSTFTDTERERNFLISDVVPYLQEYARQVGFEFRLVEMRWGIRKEASSAHQTSEICMAELERCQRESQGFSYVFLGCQKYGFRPFPAKIPQDVHESLRDKMSDEHKALLDECFLLDTNVS